VEPAVENKPGYEMVEAAWRRQVADLTAKLGEITAKLEAP
jgi:hypothetical protein